MTNNCLSVLAIVIIGVSLQLLTSALVKPSNRRQSLSDRVKQRALARSSETQSPPDTKKYLISFSTSRQSLNNWSYTEISEVLTPQECENYGESCSVHSFCALTKHTYEPVCVCEPRKCYEEPSEPICSSDGKTYNNPCEQNFRSCMFGKNATIVYRGVCDGMPEHFEGNLGYCGWQIWAENEDAPPKGGKMDLVNTRGCYQFPAGAICDKEGYIYESLCALDKSICKRKKNATLDAPYNCLKVNTPILEPRIYEHDNKLPKDVAMRFCEASGLKCPFYSVCSYHIVHEAKPWYDFTSTEVKKYFCRCESFCKKNSSIPEELTCGTDSRVYPSLCELRRTACYENRFIEEDVHYPSCLVPDVFYEIGTLVLPPPKYPDDYQVVASENCSQRRIYCSIYSECVYNKMAKENEYACRCKGCLLERPADIVCGSSGNSYNDRCELELESCIANANLTVQYKGPCVTQDMVVKQPISYGVKVYT